jgi:hypothetical protein
MYSWSAEIAAEDRLKVELQATLQFSYIDDLPLIHYPIKLDAVKTTATDRRWGQVTQ